jgi:hypothetical protein
MPRDPHAIITPASFAVAPELVGLPLARGPRRAAGMAVDLLLVAILFGMVKAPGVLLGLALVATLLRMTSRAAGGNFLKRSVRLTLRLAAAILLFVLAVNAWKAGERVVRREPSSEAAQSDSTKSRTVSVEMSDLGLSKMELIGLTADAFALSKAADSLSARRDADRLVSRLENADLSHEQLRSIADALAEEAASEDSIAVRALRGAFVDAYPAVFAPAPPPPDSARPVTDSAAAGPLDPKDSVVAQLKEQNQELIEEKAKLASTLEDVREKLEDERDRGSITHFMKSVSDDLGFGFGWAALYFTAFLALWRGQTPGKRLLGMRVIRLNGKPISWWTAFERFGGYTASVATGLLGFAQILWDRNRQGLHDKVAETVVILTEWENPAARGADEMPTPLT